MFGHGTFVYDPKAAKKRFGSHDATADAVLSLGMSHAWLRVHNKDGLWQASDNKELAAALARKGISVFGWGWCDGNEVEHDIANVHAALQTFNLAGYVADIEHGESGARWTSTKIESFLKAVKQDLSGRPLLVSTFGFIPWHEPQLMTAADQYVDAFAPQVYWFNFPKEKMLSALGASGHEALDDPASYAGLCIDVWRRVVTKPLVLTGQAYWGEVNEWTQQRAESKLKEFVENFDRYQDIAGLNWWHLAGDRAMSPSMMETIRGARLNERFAAGEKPQPLSATVTLKEESGALKGDEETAFVAVDSLNLRTRPGEEPDTVVRALDIGTELRVVGPADRDGRVRVSVELADRHYDGVVFNKYLRAPQPGEIEALLHQAYAEWFRFQRGAGSEVSPPYAGYVGEMWEALGIHGRDGTDPTPWSAAFISWIVRRAGYANFKFSALHAQYIHEAIKRREMRLSGPFWGFHLNEHKPQLGDLICQWREKLVDYEYAEDHDGFSSHADVVVQVNSRSVRTIGGNTGQSEFKHVGSVAMKTYQLDPDGYLVPENRVFAVLRNNFGRGVVTS